MPGEFEVIRRYFSPATTHTLLAGGDDAALIEVSEGMALAVSTDMLVGGRHFFEAADARGIGHKSLAVNLSDMAAMGAVPRWATLSIALPAADETWIAEFATGFLDLARKHGVDLVGGDTTRGPLNICVQIMGEVPAARALRRSGARVGDDVWVSGTLGDAALGLACLRGETELPDAERRVCLERLERPQPRLDLGVALPGLAHSAIDVSDGLVADLGHVAEASRVRAVIEWQAIPLSSAGERRRDEPLVQESALAGGDDYELCFTAPAGRREALASLGERLGLRLSRIGRIEAGSGVMVMDGDGRPLTLRHAGFDHFE